MLATAGPLPEGSQWRYEFKWDGVRALLAAPDETAISISARSGADITSAYPEVVEYAKRLLAATGGTPLRLDGEIVAFGPGGRPSFGALQTRMAVSSADRARRLAVETPVAFLPFDILQLDSDHTLDLPYFRRRELLEALPIEVPPSMADLSGAAMLAIARQQGLEGVVAKRHDRPYDAGRRSPHWIKFAIKQRQDVVIGGWEPGQHGRTGQLGALLVGVHDEAGRLVYAGQVGSGFSDAALLDVQRRLTILATDTPPFSNLRTVPVRDHRYAHWVRPELVAAVEFRHWTSEGRLRAPSFKGLRADISPEAVVRDTD